VAPAELTGGFTIDPLKELVIDITVDIAGRLTGPSAQRPYGSGSRLPQPPSGPTSPLPQAPYFGSGSVGYIVFEDGRLLFNGRPLVDPFEEELAALCRMARQGR
jgi:hypothetical protein